MYYLPIGISVLGRYIQEAPRGFPSLTKAIEWTHDNLNSNTNYYVMYVEMPRKGAYPLGFCAGRLRGDITLTKCTYIENNLPSLSDLTSKSHITYLISRLVK